jgi:type I restriction enzyme S subunit
MINRMSYTVALNKIAQPILRPIDVITGTLYRTLGVRWWGEGAYERESIDGSQTAAKTLSIVREGDLIINKIWVRHGSIAIVGKEVDGCAASGEFPTFELDTSQIFPRWLYWFIKSPSFWEKCAQLSQGTSGKNRIKPELFLTIEIPLPPLDEQRRIVTRIEELAAKVEEARGLRRQSVEEAEALTLTGSTELLKAISSDGILAHVLNEKPRNGWSAPCNNMPKGIPVLSLGAITGFRYRETEFKRTSECVFDEAHYWLRPGDLLMTRSNTSELVGHAAIYNGYPSPCIYPDLMMRLDVNESKADKYFVLHWLSCVLVRDYIKAKAKGTSPTMKKITQDVVMNVPFPSDIPLPEQRRIVAYLDNLQTKVDALKRLQNETAAELDALLPSILDKAFNGEL